MRSLSTDQSDFPAYWAKIQERDRQPQALTEKVLAILKAVSQKGDKALLELAAKYDGVKNKNVEGII